MNTKSTINKKGNTHTLMDEVLLRSINNPNDIHLSIVVYRDVDLFDFDNIRGIETGETISAMEDLVDQSKTDLMNKLQKALVRSIALKVQRYQKNVGSVKSTENGLEVTRIFQLTRQEIMSGAYKWADDFDVCLILRTIIAQSVYIRRGYHFGLNIGDYEVGCVVPNIPPYRESLKWIRLYRNDFRYKRSFWANTTYGNGLSGVSPKVDEDYGDLYDSFRKYEIYEILDDMSCPLDSISPCRVWKSNEPLKIENALNFDRTLTDTPLIQRENKSERKSKKGTPRRKERDIIEEIQLRMMLAQK